MNEEQQKQCLKDVNWMSRMTNKQWDSIINGTKGAARSRLKRRLAEFHVVIWEVNRLDPEFCETAEKMAHEIWERFMDYQERGKAVLE